MTPRTAPVALDSETLRQAIIARVPHRSDGAGHVRWPAIPALLDDYTDALLAIFAALGRPFDNGDRELLRAALSQAIASAYADSHYARVLIEYRTGDTPEQGISYEIKHEVYTIADEYQEWVRLREPPLFGTHPDAKVVSVAQTLGPPERVTILDVGAGSGRNTIALAKAGYHVDAVELAPALAKVMRESIAQEKLDATVIEGDALQPGFELTAGRYQLIVLSEVTIHFRTFEQLRQVFERAASWLAPNGLLVFSVFVAADDYERDTLALQASQAFWSSMYTRQELAQVSRELGMTRVSDESAYAFERKHLATDAWPPAGWFPQWARGYDVFELAQPHKAPHELRWLVYRKQAVAEGLREHTIDVSASIAATPERVFERLSDPKLYKPLLPLPGIKARALDGELAPGSTRRVSWSDGSTTVERIVEWLPNVRQVYRWENTLRGPFGQLFRSAEADLTVAPTPTGAVVYWTYRFEPRHRWLEPLMNIVQGAFDRWMRAVLQELQRVFEPKAQK